MFKRHAQTVDLDEGNAASSFALSSIKGFRHDHPSQADLLTKRFLENESIKSLASQLFLSQEQVNRQQKAAIHTLAEWVLLQNSREQNEFELSLTNSLISPTYTKLFGVEKVTSSLTVLLETATSPWLIALVGLGGIGKSAIADWTVRKLIPNFPFQHLLWLRADQGQSNRLDKQPLLSQLAERFLDSTTPHANQFGELRKYLKRNPGLIILDNVDTELADLEFLDMLHDLGNPSKFLLTSRRLPAPLAQVYVLYLNELEPAPARDLLAYETAQRGLHKFQRHLGDYSKEIYARTGGNPLALRLVAGLAQIWSLPAILEALQQKDAGDVEKMYASIFEQSWQALSDHGQRLMLSMLLLGSDGARGQHLAAISGLEAADLRKALFELRQRSLLKVWGTARAPRYGIHHLSETFLRSKLSPGLAETRRG